MQLPKAQPGWFILYPGRMIVLSNIADVLGIRLGHSSDAESVTGFTVVLCEKGATGSVVVLGGAPGTRETDLMRPSFTVSKVHGVFLAGGSAFGLNAASGVVRYLEEKGVGFDTGVHRVPIVAGAVIFDLDIGDPLGRPTPDMAYIACVNSEEGISESGNVGVGIGATVGKTMGPQYRMKSGLGNSLVSLPEGFKVGCVMAVNALGDVFDFRTGRELAGAYDRESKRFVGLSSGLPENSSQNMDAGRLSGKNTTIGVVATDAGLTKEECYRVAIMAMGGLARVVRPCFTPFDGDTIFVLSTGERDQEGVVPSGELRASLVAQIGMAAQEAVAWAIIDGVTSCKGLAGVPSMTDLGLEFQGYKGDGR